MIHPFDTTVTVNGIEYDIYLEGSDIHLQSMHHDIIIEGGKDDLMEICEEELKRSTYENGRPAQYTRAMVEDFFCELMAQYAYDHASEGRILNHICN